VAVFASVIVDGGVNYRTEASKAFEDRLAGLCEIVGVLTRSCLDVDTVLFPAGYFCTTRHSQASEIATRVAARIAELGAPFTVVWGIDGWTDEAKQELRCDENGYPFFAFAKRAGCNELTSFHQTAITAEEGRSEALASRWNRRSVTICGTSNALLICGECWSDQLLERVRTARPTALLIPAHRKVNLMDASGGGWSRQSWHLRLQGFNGETRIPVILSEHTRSPGRHSYSWGGRRTEEVDLPAALTSQFTVKLTEV
jgi:hypothetical protein